MQTICGTFEEVAHISPAVKDYRFLLRSLTRDIAASLSHHKTRLLTYFPAWGWKSSKSAST
jgi:hypothetical protein